MTDISNIFQQKASQNISRRLFFDKSAEKENYRHNNIRNLEPQKSTCKKNVEKKRIKLECGVRNNAKRQLSGDEVQSAMKVFNQKTLLSYMKKMIIIILAIVSLRVFTEVINRNLAFYLIIYGVCYISCHQGTKHDISANEILTEKSISLSLKILLPTAYCTSFYLSMKHLLQMNESNQVEVSLVSMAATINYMALLYGQYLTDHHFKIRCYEILCEEVALMKCIGLIKSSKLYVRDKCRLARQLLQLNLVLCLLFTLACIFFKNSTLFDKLFDAKMFGFGLITFLVLQCYTYILISLDQLIPNQFNFTHQQQCLSIRLLKIKLSHPTLFQESFKNIYQAIQINPDFLNQNCLSKVLQENYFEVFARLALQKLSSLHQEIIALKYRLSSLNRNQLQEDQNKRLFKTWFNIFQHTKDYFIYKTIISSFQKESLLLFIIASLYKHSACLHNFERGMVQINQKISQLRQLWYGFSSNTKNSVTRDALRIQYEMLNGLYLDKIQRESKDRFDAERFLKDENCCT